MFYESDNISHVMPGKKYFVSVKKEGKRPTFSKAIDSEQFERGVLRIQGEISVKLDSQNLLNWDLNIV